MFLSGMFMQVYLKKTTLKGVFQQPVSVILGIGSIIVSIVLYYSYISRKLDILIERNNTLRIDQAKDLISLYLDSIQRELHIAIRDFIEKNLVQI